MKPTGEPLLLKLRVDLDEWVRAESRKTGKPMVRIIEDLLAYRLKFKVWPPA